MVDIQSLQNVRLFQNLDTASLATIAHAARQRHLPRDTFLFHEDEPAIVFYVLLEGHGRLVQVTAEGQQVVLGFVGPAQEVGIVAALRNATYPASMQAITDCTLLAWDSLVLMDLMEQYPLLALRALRMVTGRFVQLQNQYRELATERVERRVARALLRLLQQTGQQASDGILLDLPLSRQDLAEMTGTTLYTVSRILSGWEKQGFIESGRERVVIRSPDNLVNIAEDLRPGTGSKNL